MSLTVTGHESSTLVLMPRSSPREVRPVQRDSLKGLTMGGPGRRRHSRVGTRAISPPTCYLHSTANAAACGVSDSTHGCESDIRALGSTFRCFG